MPTATKRAPRTKRTEQPQPVAEFVAQPVVAAPQTKVTFRDVMMTPQLANDILQRNTRNRPLRQSRVDRYARDMKRGDWKVNGETVSISDKGNLMNGQHRLHAVIKADVTVPMTLAEGVDESTFGTLDAGLARTAGDVLGMRGISHANNVAAMARMALNYKDGLSISTPRSNREIEDAFDQHPEMQEYISQTLPLIKLSHNTVMVTACFIASRFGEEGDEERMREFVKGVATGANLEEDDPRLVFRNKMLAMNQDRQRRPEQVVIWYFTQRAIQHYLGGSKLTKLATQKNLRPYFSEIPSATREKVKEAW